MKIKIYSSTSNKFETISFEKQGVREFNYRKKKNKKTNFETIQMELNNNNNKDLHAFLTRNMSHVIIIIFYVAEIKKTQPNVY